MPVDDDDLKVRRNLVVYSAVVLILAWLDIPFSALIGKFVEHKFPDSENYKLWAVGLAFLAYLGIRYSFSTEGGKYRTDINAEYKRLLVEKAMSSAQFQANLFTWTGLEPIVFDGKLKEYIRATTKDMGDDFIARARGVRPKIHLTMSDYRNAPWDFSMGVAVAWDRSGKLVGSSSGGFSIGVKITGIYRLLMSAYAKLHAVAYSASSIKYLVPIALGLAATYVIVRRVFLAYVAAWL